MESAPPIGMLVKVKIWHRYFPLTGLVVEVHPLRHYDLANPRWHDPDYDPPSLGYKPERDWLITMKVHRIPPNWDYFDSDLFQPRVYDIEPA
jgi:hypothetical protein